LKNNFKKRVQYFFNLPLLTQHVAASQRNLRINSEKLAKIQEKKLRLIIRYAYEHNIFYHKLYREKKVNPYEIKTITDLKKIPIVERKTMQDNFPRTVSIDVDPNQCFKLQTSGSTGMPLTVLVDTATQIQRRILSLRQFFECGGKRKYKQMEFRNVDDMPLPVENIPISIGRKLIDWPFPRSIRVPINNIALDRAKSILLKKKPEVIFGYPSFLYSLVETLEEKYGSQILFTTGEMLTYDYRKMIKSKFCGNIIDSYGCTEVGDIGWECPNEHVGYHLNTDSVFVEFIKEGNNVSDGEEGEIVLTDLTNTAMPFIRYKIGDIGLLGDSLCSCGRTLPLMRTLKGRSDDFVLLPSGKKISPLALLDLNTMKGIFEFRVVQRNSRLIELWIRAAENTEVNVQKFVSAVKDVIGEDIEIRIRLVEKIPVDKSGKLRRIISDMV